MRCRKHSHLARVLSLVTLACWLVIATRDSAKAQEAAAPSSAARLEQLSASEKEELRQKKDRFEKLPADQQTQLRAMEQQLASAADGDKLRDTMLRYHEWLRSLPSSERTEILSAPSADRVAKIRALMEKQEIQDLAKLASVSLNEDDIQKARDWFQPIVQRSLDKLVKELPKDKQERIQRESNPKLMAISALMTFGFEFREKAPERLDKVLNISQEDRQNLVSQLSSQAQDVYRKANTEDEQRAVIRNWLQVMFHRGPSFRPSPEMLQKMLAGLDPAERDRIENLPPDKRREELMKKLSGSWRFGGRGFKGPPPGERGPNDRGPNDRGPNDRGPPPDDRRPRDEPRD